MILHYVILDVKRKTDIDHPDNTQYNIPKNRNPENTMGDVPVINTQIGGK